MEKPEKRKLAADESPNKRSSLGEARAKMQLYQISSPAHGAKALAGPGIRQSSLGTFKSSEIADTGDAADAKKSHASAESADTEPAALPSLSSSKVFGGSAFGSGSTFGSLAAGSSKGLSFGSLGAGLGTGSSPFAALASSSSGTPSSFASLLASSKGTSVFGKPDKKIGGDASGDAASNKKGDDDDDDDENEEEEEDGRENGDDNAGAEAAASPLGHRRLHSQPLPEPLAVVTGEEDEMTLHSVRGKLFAWDGENWRERGTGPIKINQRAESEKGEVQKRLVMRADGVLRVILNVRIIPGMPHKLRDAKFIEIVACEKPPTLTKFLFKFGNPDAASAFLSAIESAAKA
ncbi:Ran-binding protein 3 [Polyrhizophydium stewartii]|uniref:Ran-binding protein 3 n=1 Tax=Polyrhizophydium stewartii TaxID=2732419 RepID=A0ABR4NFB2_9FUNG